MSGKYRRVTLDEELRAQLSEHTICELETALDQVCLAFTGHVQRVAPSAEPPNTYNDWRGALVNVLSALGVSVPPGTPAYRADADGCGAARLLTAERNEFRRQLLAAMAWRDALRRVGLTLGGEPADCAGAAECSPERLADHCVEAIAARPAPPTKTSLSRGNDAGALWREALQHTAAQLGVPVHDDADGAPEIAAACHREVARLKAKAADAAHELARTKHDLAAAVAQIAPLTGEKLRWQREAASASSELAMVRGYLIEANECVASVSMELQRRKDECTQTASTIASLRDDLAKVNTRCQKWEDDAHMLAGHLAKVLSAGGIK